VCGSGEATARVGHLSVQIQMKLSGRQAWEGLQLHVLGRRRDAAAPVR